MAETRFKRTSYPSKQPRFGPAPLASFEDLSDEIPSTDTSPEEESTAEARDFFDLTPDLQLPTSGNETEDEIRTFSDGITPSTPRVLAQTPSTPLALSELGTPEFLIGHSVSCLSGDFHASPSPKDVASPKAPEEKYNIFSPRNSPIVERLPFTFNVVDNNVEEEAEEEEEEVSDEPITTSIIYKIVDPAADRALAAAQEERADGGAQNLNQSSATSSLKSRAGSGTGSVSRVGSATPSPRSARKLFSMSFFKPREDRSPSPISSPKSPLKLSPMASPKSPRRSSPFGLSLFKSHGDQSPSSLSASPTKKKSHFPNFLRGKDPIKSPVQEPSSGGKSGKHGGPGVFSTLFRRDHKDGGSRADGKTPEEEEWISFSRTHLPTTRMDESKFAAISSDAIDSDEPSDAAAVASTSSPNDPYHGGIYINIFERQSPTPGDKDDDDIVNIENAFDGRLSNELFPRLNNGVGTNYFESAQDFGIHVDDYDPALRLGLSPSNGDILEKNKPPVPAAEFKTTTREIAEIAIVPTTTFDHSLSASAGVTEEKLSPESERDDSLTLKYSKPDEPETETLLREDSFENDTESSAANSALVQMALERENDLSEISKRRERIAKFQPHPVDRPRSILPLNYSSFEEYVSFVSKTSNSSSLSTEEQTPAAGGSLSESSSATKLKVTLPKEEFQLKQRQSRKALFKSWVEFCEVGLQSPRTRRRHLSDKTCRSPSSMPATRTATLEDDLDRRTESLDYTLTGSGCEMWTTFEATHSVARHAYEVSFESDVFAGASESKLSSMDITDSISSLKSPPDTIALQAEVRSDSSRSSSPKEELSPKICDKSHAFLLNLGDEEVEPLVKNVLSRDVSKELLFDDATSAPPLPPPYAATTSGVITPIVLPAQRFDDDDVEDKYLQQWWPADTPTLVSCAKQSAARAIPETNGK